MWKTQFLIDIEILRSRTFGLKYNKGRRVVNDISVDVNQGEL